MAAAPARVLSIVISGISVSKMLAMGDIEGGARGSCDISCTVRVVRSKGRINGGEKKIVYCWWLAVTFGY